MKVNSPELEADGFFPITPSDTLEIHQDPGQHLEGDARVAFVILCNMTDAPITLEVVARDGSSGPITIGANNFFPLRVKQVKETGSDSFAENAVIGLY